MDLKPDKNGLYTLMFKDKKRKGLVLFIDLSEKCILFMTVQVFGNPRQV